MFQHRFSQYWSYGMLCCLPVVAMMLTSCSLLFPQTPLTELMEFPWPHDTPIKVAEDGGVKVIFEDTGNIAVLNGFACASSERDGKEDVIRIRKHLNLVDTLADGAGWVTDATVFLNGWRVTYLNNKHNVATFSAAIEWIEFERQVLSWQAGGALAENDFDAGYRFCYNYTILAWNNIRLAATVDHHDDGNTFLIFDEFNQSTTGRHVLRNYRQEMLFIENATPAAVLPRGFGMARQRDAPLLQAAYEMGESSNSVTAGANYGELQVPPDVTADTTRYGDGAISWESSLILKDTDAPTAFYGAELVSILAGASIQLLHPPFSITPQEEVDQDCGGSFPGCSRTDGDTPRVITREITVANLDFDYAVPVLSGWSLGYRVDDHAIQDLGVQIVDFSYDRPPGALTGNLHYTISMVVDNREKDEPVMRHRVSVLGINYPVAPPACSDMDSDADNGHRDLATPEPQIGPATNQ